MTGSIVRVFLALFVALTSLTAHALTNEELAPLAGDDFEAKSAAIDKLIATGDALSVAVLNALSDGLLVATDDGHVYIQSEDGHKDPVTGKTAEAPDGQQITLSNILRTKVAGALSGLQLASPDIANRRETIAALLKNPDASMKSMIYRARAIEQDPDLKKRLDTLWAMTALHNPT